MNTSSSKYDIPTVSDPERSPLERQYTWITVGICAIFVVCGLAWLSQFAAPVLALLKAMAS